MVKKKNYIAPKDWKYMEQSPYGDPDFDPEHNRRVIEEVDKWNDEMDRKRDREYKEKLDERSAAIAQYFKNITQGRGVTKIDEYFGKRHLAYLRGQEVVKKLQSNPALLEKIKKKWAKRGELKPL